MKRIFAVILAACIILSFAACGGNVRKAEIVQWEPSQLYSDREIHKAIDVVMDYFQAGFDDCTLKQISYPGDDAADEFRQWAEQYDADEAIVLYSSFDVGPSGGDGSLNPNSTYHNWKWVLVRDRSGSWKHKTHGYG